MPTKIEIDARWRPLHQKVSDAYYALPEDKRGAVWLLWQKFHTWLSASWELEYIANGIIPDEQIIDDKGTTSPVSPVWNDALKFSPTLKERDELALKLGVAF